MKLSFADWMIILAFGLVTFFHFRGFGPVREEVATEVLTHDGISSSLRQNSGEKKRLLLFILDFRDFSCMVCLESFLELYHRLPFQIKIRDSWGILIVPPEQEGDKAAIGIAEKKLEGFIQSHQILFPVLVDRCQVFGETAEKGSGVVLFDEERGMVKRFDFPLRGEQFQEILEIVAE